MAAQRLDVPEGLKALFWDVDFGTLDFETYKGFVIERILVYGRSEDVRWLMKRYSDEEIREAVKTSRALDARTARFWAAHFGLSDGEVRCLKEPLVPTSWR